MPAINPRESQQFHHPHQRWMHAFAERGRTIVERETEKMREKIREHKRLIRRTIRTTRTTTTNGSKGESSSVRKRLVLASISQKSNDENSSSSSSSSSPATTTTKTKTESEYIDGETSTSTNTTINDSNKTDTATNEATSTTSSSSKDEVPASIGETLVTIALDEETGLNVITLITWDRQGLMLDIGNALNSLGISVREVVMKAGADGFVESKFLVSSMDMGPLAEKEWDRIKERLRVSCLRRGVR